MYQPDGEFYAALQRHMPMLKFSSNELLNIILDVPYVVFKAKCRSNFVFFGEKGSVQTILIYEKKEKKRFHLFIHQIFIEHLLCARYYLRHWEHRSELNRKNTASYTNN